MISGEHDHHAVGITTRGACADSVRNVTGCIHAGVWPGELFDVMPYVMATHEYFLFHPLNLTLPRKFKIAFSSCAEDCAQAPVNDIGYFPRLRDGKQGFAVHAGGGLGSQPFLARPICEFLPVEDVLIMSEAIIRLQHRSGERKNRKKARMKYLFQRLGEAPLALQWRVQEQCPLRPARLEDDRQVLAPLASDWNRLDAQRKQKWRGLAQRYPTMAPDQQQRGFARGLQSCQRLLLSRSVISVLP